MLGVKKKYSENDITTAIKLVLAGGRAPMLKFQPPRAYFTSSSGSVSCKEGNANQFVLGR
jgi:hypothetical protein